MVFSSPSILLPWQYFSPFYGEYYGVIFHCVSTHTHTHTQHTHTHTHTHTHPCIFLSQLSVDGHMGCFCILAVVSSAVMNIGLHVSFGIVVFSWYICKSGISRSYGSLIFSFSKNHHTVLHSSCTNSHSH